MIDPRTVGTGLQGYLDASLARVVDVFGEPGVPGDPDKIHVEWTVDTPARRRHHLRLRRLPRLPAGLRPRPTGVHPLVRRDRRRRTRDRVAHRRPRPGARPGG